MKYIFTIVIVGFIISLISKTNNEFFFKYAITLLPALLAVRSINKSLTPILSNTLLRNKWLELQYKKDIRRLKKEKEK